MSAARLLRVLGSEPAVVVTASGNLATSLVAISVANIWSHARPERVIVYELTPVHRPTVERAVERAGVGAQVVFAEARQAGELGYAPSIVNGPGADRHSVEKMLRLVGRTARVWIVPSNWGLSLRLRYPLIRLTQLPSGEVVARLGRGGGERLRLTPYEVEEAPMPSEERWLRHLRDILVDLMVEHGALSVRDAINAIMAREGVDRRRAREILGMMVERGLVRVRKGIVEA